MNFASLPALGWPLEGGLFVGLTTQRDGTHCAVVLLPDKPEEPLNWNSSVEWAQGAKGELPSRAVSALLFANARGQFEHEWHWTSEAHEQDGSYAWYQTFGYGGQHDVHKSFKGRARAVRLIPLVG